MSEDKKERTLKEITEEHNKLLFMSGVLQYEIDVKSRDLKATNESIRKLNVEAAQLKAKEILKHQEAQALAAQNAAQETGAEMPKLEGNSK